MSGPKSADTDTDTATSKRKRDDLLRRARLPLALAAGVAGTVSAHMVGGEPANIQYHHNIWTQDSQGGPIEPPGSRAATAPDESSETSPLAAPAEAPALLPDRRLSTQAAVADDGETTTAASAADNEDPAEAVRVRLFAAPANTREEADAETPVDAEIAADDAGPGEALEAETAATVTVTEAPHEQPKKSFLEVTLERALAGITGRPMRADPDAEIGASPAPEAPDPALADSQTSLATAESGGEAAPLPAAAAPEPADIQEPAPATAAVPEPVDSTGDETAVTAEAPAQDLATEDVAAEDVASPQAPSDDQTIKAAQPSSGGTADTIARTELPPPPPVTPAVSAPANAAVRSSFATATPLSGTAVATTREAEAIVAKSAADTVEPLVPTGGPLLATGAPGGTVAPAEPGAANVATRNAPVSVVSTAPRAGEPFRTSEVRENERAVRETLEPTTMLSLTKQILQTLSAAGDAGEPADGAQKPPRVLPD